MRTGICCLAVAGLAIFMSACGIPEAIKAVPSVDDKIQTMTGQMQGMQQTMSGMDQKMMSVVNATNDQEKLIPMQQLMDPNNYDNLSPVPEKLMPYGQKLAQSMTDEDIVELAFLWLQAINEVNPAPDKDANGNDLPYTPAEINTINKNKLGRFYALMTVCGFLPDSTVDTMVKNQIVSYGPYEQTAYQILTLRAQFLSDVLLDGQVLDRPMKTVGQMGQAVGYAQSLDKIAKYPFTAQLSVKTTGFLKPADQLDLEFDPSVAATEWNKIKVSATNDLHVSFQAVTGDPKADQARFVQMQSDYNTDMATVNTALASWGKK